MNATQLFNSAQLSLAAYASLICPLLLSVAFTLVLTGCAGYVPGRQAYWDGRVSDLCEKDGGVLILSKVKISRKKFEELGRVGGYVSVPPRNLMRDEDVLYTERSETVVRAWNPRVIRVEQTVRRRDSHRVVARIVRYSRVGGDIPSPAHPSSFSCPDDLQIAADIETLYAVEEAK